MHHLDGALETAPRGLGRPRQLGEGAALGRAGQAAAVGETGAQQVEAQRAAQAVGELRDVREFEAAALGGAGVAEGGAAAAVGVDHDLVFGVDVVERGVEALHAVDLPLGSQLQVAAARGAQVGVEAGADVAVGQLGEGRRLVATAGVEVDVDRLRGVPGEAQHRVHAAEAEAAAVVGVARRSSGDEAVVGAEAHVDAAGAAGQRPVAVQVDAGLQVGVAVVDHVALVALEDALDAGVVDVALAVLAHAVVFDAAGQAQRAAFVERDAVRELRAQAAVVAVEAHDAAAVGVGQLRRERNAECVEEIALAKVDPPGEERGLAEAVLDDAAELVLAHGLAGVLRECGRRHRAGVGLPLRAREAERVLGVGLVERVDDHAHVRVAGEVALPAAVELAAAGGAVLAVAVGVEARGVEGDAVALGGGGAVLEAELALLVGAGRAAHGEGGDGRVVFGEDLHHAAGRVAVELSHRAAQHFDAAGRRERHVGRLALPVGHGRGDAVDDEAHAPHTEGRAGAEAADGDLQVLCVVLAVERHDARHAVEHLRQVDLRATVVDHLAGDGADGRGRVEGTFTHALRRDDHWIERVGGALRAGGLEGSQHGHGGPDHGESHGSSSRCKASDCSTAPWPREPRAIEEFVTDRAPCRRKH